jgi:hypothetical protein
VPRQLGIGLDYVDLGRLLVTELGVSRTALALARAFLPTGQRPMDGRSAWCTSPPRVTRGYDVHTGVGDAVGSGWVLAAQLKAAAGGAPLRALAR